MTTPIEMNIFQPRDIKEEYANQQPSEGIKIITNIALQAVKIGAALFSMCTKQPDETPLPNQFNPLNHIRDKHQEAFRKIEHALEEGSILSNSNDDDSDDDVSPYSVDANSS